MWDSSIIHVLSWIGMKKYQTFKVRSFLVQMWDSSIIHVLSWIFIKNIKFSKFVHFPVEMWDSSIIHARSWIFMKSYRNFKVHPFPSWDVRFKSFSCAFRNFHEEMLIFQSSFFSQLRCDIKVFFMRFHEFSSKNIEFSKFNLFPVQMWDSSLFRLYKFPSIIC
jgi:hypothetical protein